MPKGTMETKEISVAEKEMQEFINNNRQDTEFVVTKECVGKLIKGKVIKIENDERKYKGQPIINKHLIMEDGKIYSLNGTAINKQIEKMQASVELPALIQFTVVETEGKENQKYKEFIWEEL